jgi:hypothetical protein
MLFSGVIGLTSMTGFSSTEVQFQKFQVMKKLNLVLVIETLKVTTAAAFFNETRKQMETFSKL